VLVAAGRVHGSLKHLEIVSTVAVSNLVSDAVERARRAWPELRSALEGFHDHVLGLGVPDEDLELHGHELYLAFACSLGDADALRVLEREYLIRAAPVFARMDRSREFREEALQALRERLLVGSKPRIGQYAATGALAAWLRVAALRLGVSIKRAPRPNDGALADAIAGVDIGNKVDDERYRETLQSALIAAFEALTPRQRNVLRLYYIDGQSIDRIGQFYGAHRATAARWMVSAREQIFELVTKRVQNDLGITRSEVRSAIAMVRSQLEVSVMRLLSAERERDSDPAGGG
jgi:RNA polymerase sigma-70 factor, ECF subfamily